MAFGLRTIMWTRMNGRVTTVAGCGESRALRWVVFSLGVRRFAIGLEHVVELVDAGDPSSPPAALESVRVRNAVLPAMDLRTSDSIVGSSVTWALVLRGGSGRAAVLVVDFVEELAGLVFSCVEGYEPPWAFGPATVVGMAMHEGTFVTLLSGERAVAEVLERCSHRV